MIGLDVTDVRRETIPLLWTSTKKNVAKAFSFNVGNNNNREFTEHFGDSNPFTT